MSHTTVEFKYNGERCTVEEVNDHRWYYMYGNIRYCGFANEIQDKNFIAEADRVFDLETGAIAEFIHGLTN